MTVRTLRQLYVDLLIKCISNAIYKDDPAYVGIRGTFVEEARAIGLDWPSKAHSMVGYARLNNIADLAQSVLDRGIPGDFVETGVWRGGSCILMRGILAANDVTDRMVYVCDSFAGLPKPNADLYPADEGYDLSTAPELAVSQETVAANFDLYGLLDDRVTFVKGWFSDTLPTLDAGPFGLLRLDGDLYESTIVALEALYPRLSPGGFIIIDDYAAVAPCRQATEDYRSKHRITDPIQVIDWSGIWWQKS